ncbi:MAG TPA: PspC domain-containing protein [Anaerolineaceae bacterium]|jgi:phage shock protein PspC (stress-responsive transcriptional regulator)|nr:PspC domain-containing protein [Anaerolineaceae bacterium]HQH85694.1 PspC domain-containing protein [Anaerolineaceae bacterium]
MNTRLTRSKTERMLGGVCVGLGRYLKIDPVFVRLFFILLAIGDGIGVLLYLILWLVLPEESAEEASLADRARQMGADFGTAISHPNPKTGMYIGIGLIVLGAVYLLNNLNIPGLAWLNLHYLWPVLLILGGLVLLLRRDQSQP